MEKLWYVPALALLGALAACSQSRVAPAVEYPAGSLEREIEAVRRAHNLPALAAVIVKEDGTRVEAAVGVRKVGSPEPVTARDKFHLGSAAKPLTATLAGILVDQGVIGWDTQVQQVFNDWSADIHPDFLTVTLRQLLAQRGGVVPFTDPATEMPQLWRQLRDPTISPAAARDLLARTVLARAPEYAPGTQWRYSNAGYSVAGAMLERVTGRSFERLISEHVFAPLAMPSAGFGPPASSAQRVDQPWGHEATPTRIIAVPPEPDSDNPPALAPAGTAHASVGDMAQFALMHLRATRGGTDFISAATVSVLNTPLSENVFDLDDWNAYTTGWLAVDDQRGEGIVLMHDGSNGTFYSVIWIAPERKLAFVISANLGGAQAGAALNSAITVLSEYAER